MIIKFIYEHLKKSWDSHKKTTCSLIIELLDWKSQQQEVCNSIHIVRLIYNAKVCSSQHKQTEDNQQSRQTFLEFGIM